MEDCLITAGDIRALPCGGTRECSDWHNYKWTGIASELKLQVNWNYIRTTIKSELELQASKN